MEGDTKIAFLSPADLTRDATRPSSPRKSITRSGNSAPLNPALLSESRYSSSRPMTSSK